MTGAVACLLEVNNYPKCQQLLLPLLDVVTAMTRKLLVVVSSYPRRKHGSRHDDSCGEEDEGVLLLLRCGLLLCQSLGLLLFLESFLLSFGLRTFTSTIV